MTFTWALRWGCLRWESSCQELRGILTSAGCEVPGPSSWWTLPWWWWPHRRELEPLGRSPTHHKTPRADLGEIRREREWEGRRPTAGYTMKAENCTLYIYFRAFHFFTHFVKLMLPHSKMEEAKYSLTNTTEWECENWSVAFLTNLNKKSKYCTEKTVLLHI